MKVEITDGIVRVDGVSYYKGRADQAEAQECGPVFAQMVGRGTRTGSWQDRAEQAEAERDRAVAERDAAFDCCQKHLNSLDDLRAAVAGTGHELQQAWRARDTATSERDQWKARAERTEAKRDEYAQRLSVLEAQKHMNVPICPTCTHLKWAQSMQDAAVAERDAWQAHAQKIASERDAAVAKAEKAEAKRDEYKHRAELIRAAWNEFMHNMRAVSWN